MMFDDWLAQDNSDHPVSVCEKPGKRITMQIFEAIIQRIFKHLNERKTLSVFSVLTYFNFITFATVQHVHR